MLGKLRQFNPLQAPYIKVNVKITNPGITNGKPNIKYEDEYVRERGKYRNMCFHFLIHFFLMFLPYQTIFLCGQFFFYPINRH